MIKTKWKKNWNEFNSFHPTWQKKLIIRRTRDKNDFKFYSYKNENVEIKKKKLNTKITYDYANEI